MDILESQLGTKNQWDLVPAHLDMGKGESKFMSRNYGLIDNHVFEGKETSMYLREEVCTILDIQDGAKGGLQFYGK